MVTTKRVTRAKANGNGHAGSEALGRMLEIVTAERDAALDALCFVFTHVRQLGGYMEPETQARMRAIEALLVGSGRKV